MSAYDYDVLVISAPCGLTSRTSPPWPRSAPHHSPGTSRYRVFAAYSG